MARSILTPIPVLTQSTGEEHISLVTVMREDPKVKFSEEIKVERDRGSWKNETSREVND